MDTQPHRFVLTQEFTGQPIVQAVAAAVGLEVALELLWHGGVWIDGRRVADPLDPAPAAGQVVLHYPPARGYAQIDVGAGDLLFEDEWLIALNKRAGWYSGATPWDVRGNVLAALGRYLAARNGAAARLHLAHQLDRDTTGVLLISKSPLVNAGLYKAFSEGKIEKRYLCLCTGEPEQEIFALRSGHGRSAGGRWRIYPLEQVGAGLPGGSRVRLAHSEFRLHLRLGGAALVEALPHTGRTHQIRLHMAFLGHPLLGDTRYGGPAHFRGRELSGHLLHAARLALAHPATGTRLELRAAPPSLFSELQTL